MPKVACAILSQNAPFGSLGNLPMAGYLANYFDFPSSSMTVNKCPVVTPISIECELSIIE